MRIPDRVFERLMTKVAAGVGGCWISTYSVGSHGYAQVGWTEAGRRSVTVAHRAVWIWLHGPINLGMTVDHICKVRRCVRPDHLRLLSNHDNARRTSGRDWPLGECAHGHPDSELRRQPSGKLVCEPCRQRWQRTHRERKQRASA